MTSSTGLMYELINGKIFKSTLLYLPEEKHLFKTISKTSKKTYYVCYQKNCFKRVELLHNGVCQKPKHNVGAHNHGSQEQVYNEMKCVDNLRKECLLGAGGLTDVNAISGIRKAFKRVVEKDEDASKYLDYSKMKRGLQKITNKVFVKSPRSASEVTDAFKKEDIWKQFGLSKGSNQLPFFKACIQKDDVEYCIFSSEKIVNFIKEYIPPKKRVFLADATFKIVPQGCFKQLLIIYINYFDEKVFPFIFILMNKKTTRAYIDMFEYIETNIFKLEASCFITDFETALIKGLKVIHPTATYQSCWFHYCQALRRNVSSKHKRLAETIRSNKEASLVFHKFMALALLPHYSIEAAFIMLRQKVNSSFPEGYFNVFLDYFKRQWIEKITPKHFSVFKKVTRTTSDVEAYNGVLGRMIPKNGNFFKFVKVIQDEELLKSRDFQMLIESGGVIGGKRRSMASIRRNKKIHEASELLENGSITSVQFLDRMVYPKNEICIDMEPFEDIFEEYPDDLFEEDSEMVDINLSQENSRNTCVICFNSPPNIVLLPCKHLHICSECNIKLQAQSVAENEETYKCPSCREYVEDSLQVFGNM